MAVAFLLQSTGIAGSAPNYSAGGAILPAPGSMVALSQSAQPPVLKGVKVYADEPFRFDFIMDRGDAKDEGRGTPASPKLQRGEETETRTANVSSPSAVSVTRDANKLIRYFLASLTVPETDLWVNLSPYEKDRIITNEFGQTEMGRDLLAQDYLLKQLTASVIYPEGETGKKFWAEVYKKAFEKYGTTDIPVDTFNKVWIVPEKAVVYERADVQVGDGRDRPVHTQDASAVAYVVDAKLKVMLESDYLAPERSGACDSAAGCQLPAASVNESQEMAKQVLRNVVIPVLEKEVNEGANFSQLRQVYNSLILAAWYKRKVTASLLSAVYVDKKKMQGLGRHPERSEGSPVQTGHKPNNAGGPSLLPSVVAQDDGSFSSSQDMTPEQLWQLYVQAFKKGAYNYIKEEQDQFTGETIPRKYFSGGAKFDMGQALSVTVDPAQLPQGIQDRAMIVQTDFRPAGQGPAGRAMTEPQPPSRSVEVVPGLTLSVPRFEDLPDNVDQIAHLLLGLNEQMAGYFKEAEQAYGSERIPVHIGNVAKNSYLVYLLKKYMSSTTGKRVLEIGTHDGGLMVALKAMGLRDVSGLETDPKLAGFTQGKGLSVIQGSLADPPEEVAREPYDVVISRAVLEVMTKRFAEETTVDIPRLEKALGSLAGLVRPGGISIHVTSGLPLVDLKDINWKKLGFDVLETGKAWYDDQFVVLRRTEETTPRLSTGGNAETPEAGKPTRSVGEPAPDRAMADLQPFTKPLQLVIIAPAKMHKEATDRLQRYLEEKKLFKGVSQESARFDADQEQRIIYIGGHCDACVNNSLQATFSVAQHYGQKLEMLLPLDQIYIGPEDFQGDVAAATKLKRGYAEKLKDELVAQAGQTANWVMYWDQELIHRQENAPGSPVTIMIRFYTQTAALTQHLMNPDRAMMDSNGAVYDDPALRLTGRDKEFLKTISDTVVAGRTNALRYGFQYDRDGSLASREHPEEERTPLDVFSIVEVAADGSVVKGREKVGYLRVAPQDRGGYVNAAGQTQVELRSIWLFNTTDRDQGVYSGFLDLLPARASVKIVDIQNPATLVAMARKAFAVLRRAKLDTLAAFRKYQDLESRLPGEAELKEIVASNEEYFDQDIFFFLNAYKNLADNLSRRGVPLPSLAELFRGTPLDNSRLVVREVSTERRRDLAGNLYPALFMMSEKPDRVMRAEVPRPDQEPRIDENKVQKWVNEKLPSYYSPKMKVAAKKAKQKVAEYVLKEGYISQEQFEKTLSSCVSELNDLLLKVDRYAVVFDWEAHKGARWVYGLAQDKIAKKPDRYAYSYYPINSIVAKNNPVEVIARSGINVYVLFDDAIFSGDQMYKRIVKIVYADAYRAQKNLPKILIVAPYRTHVGERKLLKAFGENIRFVGGKYIPVLEELLGDEHVADLPPLDLNASVLDRRWAINIFPNRIADVRSTFPMLNTFISPIVPPYQNEHTRYYLEEATDYRSFGETGSLSSLGGRASIDETSGQDNDRAMAEKVEQAKKALEQAVNDMIIDLPESSVRHLKFAAEIPEPEAVREPGERVEGILTTPNQVNFLANFYNAREIILDFLVKMLKRKEPVDIKSYEEFLNKAHRAQIIGRDERTVYYNETTLNAWLSSGEKVPDNEELKSSIVEGVVMEVLSGNVDMEERYRRSGFGKSRLEISFELLSRYLSLPEGASPDEIVLATADYYQESMYPNPFGGGNINNSLYMNIVNALLRLKGYNGISHGYLDRQIRMPGFYVNFGKAFMAANPGLALKDPVFFDRAMIRPEDRNILDDPFFGFSQGDRDFLTQILSLTIRGKNGVSYRFIFDRERMGESRAPLGVWDRPFESFRIMGTDPQGASYQAGGLDIAPFDGAGSYLGKDGRPSFDLRSIYFAEMKDRDQGVYSRFFESLSGVKVIKLKDVGNDQTVGVMAQKALGLLHSDEIPQMKKRYARENSGNSMRLFLKELPALTERQFPGPHYKRSQAFAVLDHYRTVAGKRPLPALEELAAGALMIRPAGEQGFQVQEVRFTVDRDRPNHAGTYSLDIVLERARPDRAMSNEERKRPIIKSTAIYDTHDKTYFHIVRAVSFEGVPSGLPIILFDQHSDNGDLGRMVDIGNWLTHLKEDNVIGHAFWVYPKGRELFIRENERFFKSRGPDLRKMVTENLELLRQGVILSFDLDYFSSTGALQLPAYSPESEEIARRIEGIFAILKEYGIPVYLVSGAYSAPVFAPDRYKLEFRDGLLKAVESYDVPFDRAMGVDNAFPAQDTPELILKGVVQKESIIPGLRIITDSAIFREVMMIARQYNVNAMFASGAYLNRSSGARAQKERDREVYRQIFEYLDGALGEHLERVVVAPASSEVTNTRHEVLHDYIEMASQKHESTFAALVALMESIRHQNKKFDQAYFNITAGASITGPPSEACKEFIAKFFSRELAVPVSKDDGWLAQRQKQSYPDMVRSMPAEGRQLFLELGLVWPDNLQPDLAGSSSDRAMGEALVVDLIGKGYPGFSPPESEFGLFTLDWEPAQRFIQPPLKDDANILLIGGTADEVYAISRRLPQVRITVVGLSREKLDQLAQEYPEKIRQGNLRLFRADASRLAEYKDKEGTAYFPDSEYDLVFGRAITEIPLPVLKGIAKQAVRVTKAGGYILHPGLFYQVYEAYGEEKQAGRIRWADVQRRGQTPSLFQKVPFESDKAMAADKGGIDLAQGDQVLEVNSTAGRPIQFDPVAIERFRDLPGLTPVIIDITPMTMSIAEFAGINGRN